MDGYGSVEGLENDGSMMTKTVSITLSAAAAYMVLVIGLMAWCRYRRRKRKQAYLDANPTSPLTDCEYTSFWLLNISLLSIFLISELVGYLRKLLCL